MLPPRGGRPPTDEVMQYRLARLVALDAMLEQAAEGERETDGSNRSPLIDKINMAAGVPVGSPYCASSVRYAFAQAGVPDFGGPGAASVGFTEQWAKDRGYLKKRPFRGDAFAWQIDGDSWPDHAGMVVRVISWGGVLFTVDTVEANTSSSKAGSQGEGGGWYLRRRTFTRGRVTFVRDPRRATKDPWAKPTEAPREAERRLRWLRKRILAYKRDGKSWAWIKITRDWAEFKRRGGK